MANITKHALCQLAWIGIGICFSAGLIIQPVFAEQLVSTEQSTPVGQPVRGANLLPDPGFEMDGRWQGYQGALTVDDAVAHTGKRSLRCEGASLEDIHGASFTITFDTPIQHPFRFSGWSRANHAAVKGDYAIYLDVHYDDGSPLWGQKALFEEGLHDWAYAESSFIPSRPVKQIDVYVLFRQARGTVWFDDIEVCLLPFKFQRIQTLPGAFRDGLCVSADTTLPALWQVMVRESGGKPLAEESGDSMPVRFAAAGPLPSRYEVVLSATDTYLHQTIRQTIPCMRTPESGNADPRCVVWLKTSMERIMPDDLPSLYMFAPSAKLELAKNEYESFQIGLFPVPGKTFTGLTVEMDDLVDAKTGARISASNVTWQQEGYVKIDKLNPHPAAPNAVSGWWPDALLPVKKFDLIPGKTQAIWVTVHTPADLPGGWYEGACRIRFPEGGDPISLQLHAQVYDFALPVKGHLKTAFALMDGFLEKVYGKPLNGAVRRAYGDFVLEHRLNPDDISRTDLPVLEDLEQYVSRGLNAFNVLNMVQERGDATWVCWSPSEQYTPAFKQHLIERLDPYVAALRDRKLLNDAYIYTFDERGKEFYPIMREYFGMVKERYPEIHTLTTAAVPQDPAVLRDLHIDWICPLTPAYSAEKAEACRAAGQQVWAYICMGPGYPYANWLIPHPLIESRVIWWQAFKERMDGFLYWGLNIWDLPHNDKPIDLTKGPFLDWSITTGGECDWLHGDGRLLYAGPDGPIGSIRLDNIRDGLEDYEYLWLLKDLAKDRKEADDFCAEIAPSLVKFSRNPTELLSRRTHIAQEIERLMKTSGESQK